MCEQCKIIREEIEKIESELRKKKDLRKRVITLYKYLRKHQKKGHKGRWEKRLFGSDEWFVFNAKVGYGKRIVHIPMSLIRVMNLNYDDILTVAIKKRKVVGKDIE